MSPIAIILICLGIGAVLIAGAIVLVISLVGGSLSKTAEADYYEIGSDKVPSVKLILGEVRDVISVNTSTGNGVTTKAIGYKVEENQSAEMEKYAMALMSSHSFYSTNDFDFSGSTGKGFEFSRVSDEDGFIIILSIDYDSDGYTITLKRGEGTLTTPAPTPEPTPEPKPEPEKTPEPPEDLPDIDTDDAFYSTFPEDGGTIRVPGPAELEITPEYEGLWIFYTQDSGTDDPVLFLYNPDGTLVQYDDDSMGDYNARLCVYLYTETTYTVVVLFYDEDTGDVGMGPGDTTVYAIAPEEIPSDGGEAVVTAPQGFLLIPEKTATYEFRTSENGEGDPMLELYDSDINLIAEDDDGGEDGNSIIRIELKAGESYSLFASFYGLGPITYTLTVDVK